FSSGGKPLWEVETRYLSIRMDGSGKRVGYLTSDPGAMTLVECATGRVVGSIPELVGGLGAGGERRVVPRFGPDGEWLGFAYCLRGVDGPILHLGIDQVGTAASARFNLDGTHVAWGNEDGSVVVCDLAAVQRKLAT